MSAQFANFTSRIQGAIDAAEFKKHTRYQCPDCEKKLALLTLSFRGLTIARLCRFCSYIAYEQMNLPAKKKDDDARGRRLAEKIHGRGRVVKMRKRKAA